MRRERLSQSHFGALDPVLAASLGRVEGAVGGRDQVHSVGSALRCGRHAEARRDPQGALPVHSTIGTITIKPKNNLSRLRKLNWHVPPSAKATDGADPVWPLQRRYHGPATGL